MPTMPNKPQAENPELRQAFERLARDSYHLKRSRKGTYINPTIARDWKWFQLGAAAKVNTP